MANKAKNLSHFVRRLPKAIKAIDQLLASSNPLTRFRAAQLIINKCIADAARPLIESQNHSHFTLIMPDGKVIGGDPSKAVASGLHSDRG